jgi:hypothetical protein
VVLKPGWLNRQFDQVSKNVEQWPDWMKRAAGVPEPVGQSRPEPEQVQTAPRREVQSSAQQRLI